MRETFVLMCREKQQITFKTMFWTFQPKREQSIYKHLPFVTWDCQDECIEKLINSIRYGGDLLVDKSREMGATWIVLGAFFAEWLLVPDSTFLVISRKEEYVWKRGNPDTLYWKLEYLLKNLPHWVTPAVDLSERHLQNLANGSVIDGESTNADVGAGGRRQAIMCDEFARVNAADADWIADTLSDTTPARIFNSTPTSRGHPFGQLRFGGRVPVFTLGWWRHPWKVQGHYESPEIDQIVIYDLEYYLRKYGDGVFEGIEEGVPFKYSNFEKMLLIRYPSRAELLELNFIADGNDPANQAYFSPTGRRSPWYDRECERRTPRDKATNIDINYVGAGDVVFNPMILLRLLEQKARPPRYEGEIDFYMRENKIVRTKFTPNQGRRRLKWWAELRGARPDQSHNYIVGCDISLGSGQSNSVLSVYDSNTNEKVGRWKCPNTSPTHFAEYVVALCQWVGGVTKMPFLIWESNGPGLIFGRRVVDMGYDFIYREREEKQRGRKRKSALGWHSSPDSKLNLCLNYDAGLDAVFREEMESKAFINPDAESLHEAEDYVFYEGGGKEIGPSHCSADEGGAKAAHGDMVIADALCCLARYDQPRAALNWATFGDYNTLAHRRREAELLRKKREEDDLWLIN
jgi:hypothetical protein